MAFLLYSGFTTNRETLSDKTVTEYILSSDFTGRRIGCDWMKIYGKLNSIIWRSMRQTLNIYIHKEFFFSFTPLKMFGFIFSSFFFFCCCCCCVSSIMSVCCVYVWNFVFGDCVWKSVYGARQEILFYREIFCSQFFIHVVSGKWADWSVVQFVYNHNH